MLNYDVKCPACGVRIRVPFMKALEAKAIKDYDLAEIDAQTKLEWFNRASLWQLIKFWWSKRSEQ